LLAIMAINAITKAASQGRAAPLESIDKGKRDLFTAGSNSTHQLKSACLFSIRHPHLGRQDVELLNIVLPHTVAYGDCKEKMGVDSLASKTKVPFWHRGHRRFNYGSGARVPMLS